MKRNAGSLIAATLIAVIGISLSPSPAVAQAAAPTAQAAPAAQPAPATKSAKSVPAAPIDLNSASEADLIALPGVGASTAKKIIAGRPYTSVDDLKKAGVSAATLTKIAPLVSVKAAAAAATPTAARPATPSPAATPAPSAKTAAAPATAQQPPVKGMVWVNLNSKVFHREGDRWYGKTKNGQFMTEADALKAGYHEAKPGAAKAKS